MRIKKLIILVALLVVCASVCMSQRTKTDEFNRRSKCGELGQKVFLEYSAGFVGDQQETVYNAKTNRCYTRMHLFSSDSILTAGWVVLLIDTQTKREIASAVFSPNPSYKIHGLNGSIGTRYVDYFTAMHFMDEWMNQNDK